MTDQELLIKAAEKLGMTHLENYEGQLWYCDLSRSTNNKLLVPPFLTSLDAHFAPGGTVEWMRKRGWQLTLHDQKNGNWTCHFWREKPDDASSADDPNPARAITLAFVQHSEV